MALTDFKGIKEMGVSASALADHPTLETFSNDGKFGVGGMAQIATAKHLKNMTLQHGVASDANVALLARHPALEVLKLWPSGTAALTDAAANDAAATDAAPTVPVPAPPQTPLVLKASGPRPERPEPTQPSPVLPDSGEDNDATQPTATTAPDDAPGPQSAFDTHGWWAEQQEAAREEQARRHAASEQDDESVAKAEEQGW